MEPGKIAAIVAEVAKSGLSVEECVRRKVIPFSGSRYFRYRRRLAEGGPEALVDGRSRGNHRKLTADAKGLLRGAHRGDPRLSLQQLGESLEADLGIGGDRSTASPR